MPCIDGKDHELEIIYETLENGVGCSTVVRWCSVCGGIVVDLDVDNRTMPGGISKMKFPKILFKRKKEEDVPRIFFNTSEEDKEAVLELFKSGVNCVLCGPIAEERTPLLIYKSMRFYGLDTIKNFAKRWKEEKE
jgi:hypothetical protein